MPSGWEVEIKDEEDEDEGEPKTKKVGLLGSLAKTEDDLDVFTAVLSDSERGQGVAITFEESDIVVFVVPDPDDKMKVLVLGYGRKTVAAIANDIPEGDRDTELGKVSTRLRLQLKRE